MKQISDGMLSAQPVMAASMARVVQPYPIRPSATAVAAAVQASGGSGSASGNGTLHLTLQIDSSVVGEMSAKYIESQAKLRLSPGKRGFRVA